MGIAGIIATLTSVNTAMLSATREAFTLSRDGVLPRFLSYLSRFRTPYGAVLVIGVICSLVAAIGLVDFLTYASSSGYLFVLFWSNLAMIRLRKRFPDLNQPFKVPFFPLTAYLTAGTCLLIIGFTNWKALLFSPPDYRRMWPGGGWPILRRIRKTFWIKSPRRCWPETCHFTPSCARRPASPTFLTARVVRAATVPEGILQESARESYDLVVIGASEEWISQTRLFGSVSDWIAEHVPCHLLGVTSILKAQPPGDFRPPGG